MLLKPVKNASGRLNHVKLSAAFFITSGAIILNRDPSLKKLQLILLLLGGNNMQENDQRFIRTAIEIAWNARNKGNHPFGALLVNENGQIVLEAENTVLTDKDITGHAETNLMREASSKYDREFLGKCTLYTSTEPCPMCVGAIFWGNVRRIVYGLSEESLYEIIGWHHEDILYVPCRELFGRGQKPIEVIGPILEEEAREVHVGFWK
jgi:tRNA(Arg) A34 adenosine deaminase TadA